MLQANKFRLGIFVTVGVVLIVASFIIHGMADAFKEKIKIFTVFDESVQGLEIGSEVKYKGVTLGSVTKRYLYRDRYVKVEMELVPGAGSKDNESQYEGLSKQEKIKRTADFIKREKLKGFSCQLTMSGITGLKFIEFDHIKDAKNIFELKDVEEENYIPSRKSLLAGTMISLDEALRKIASVDFIGISNEIKTTLSSFRNTYANNDIQQAVKDVSTTAAHINETVAAVKDKILKGEYNQLAESLNKTLKEIRELAIAMENELKSMKLGKPSETANTTLESTTGAARQFEKSIASIEGEFNNTLVEIQALIKEATKIRQDLNVLSKNLGAEATDLKDDVSESLKRLNQTLESMDALFKMIEKDPSSLLRGKASK